MNDAKNRRFFRARRRKVVGSFRKRVGRRVVFQLEISGKFCDFTQINFANSDTYSKQELLLPINFGNLDLKLRTVNYLSNRECEPWQLILNPHS